MTSSVEFVVSEDPAVALVLVSLADVGHLGEAELGPDGGQVLAQDGDVVGSLDDEVDVLADGSVRGQVHAQHGGAEDSDGTSSEQGAEFGVQPCPR
jgi:hypothetical protein